MSDTISPLNLSLLWQIPQIEPTRNYDYISNIIANGLIQDFFVPGIAAQNPFLKQVNDFNQNIGILQTATNGISQILNYVDILKNINPNQEQVFKELTNELNDVIKNTSYNSIPVFQEKIQLNNQNVNLSIPTLDLSNINIEDYEKLLTKKQEDLFKVLNNISLEVPTHAPNNFNSYETEALQEIINSGELVNAYNANLINPFTFQLLLS